MMVPYKFAVRSEGRFVPGLKPVWAAFMQFSGADMTRYAPPIRELGGGYYGWSWDAELGGDVFGTIDAGPSVPAPADRLIEQEAVRETSRVLGLKPSSSSPAGPTSA